MLSNVEGTIPAGAELVIVGAGVVGASTAFWAARAGLSPVVLEALPVPAALTTPVATGAFRLQFDNPEETELVRESVDLILDFTTITGQDSRPLGVRQPDTSGRPPPRSGPGSSGGSWLSSTPGGRPTSRSSVGTRPAACSPI